MLNRFPYEALLQSQQPEDVSSMYGMGENHLSYFILWRQS